MPDDRHPMSKPEFSDPTTMDAFEWFVVVVICGALLAAIFS